MMSSDLEKMELYFIILRGLLQNLDELCHIFFVTRGTQDLIKCQIYG